ncbi:MULTISPECIES: TetR/AcrR family transcriptional regulator [Streptomyces]|uniref:TetR/AcrR family transcriptional regulator C-terminal domain-containing protein n=1 Tax=Streptomyces koelreuteriae TaxID=2838015 RepID=A0ABX8FUZ4_9ACTN|nr:MULTISPECIES: TetR/AcrR family transcriptional regulator [Streptomyces]QWB24879.1 TetR/AcrR family transcriptional regulator C-terminal domain-containing protein [Streptomyces koelreuteriae]UUA07895.1 TetR/AcrR family transcriptional regulator [Streptomyces koelreuteriae]UUA15524.1 TetR/AcrR family transcriptional regulator [Streptomyces sp. CRCS-T-1]
MTSGASGTSGAGSTETSGSGDITRTLELLWDTGRRPSRGPKPTLTLDRIVEAAVQLADAEGLGGLSMRRVAAELGTGTMSLYRYIPGKNELLDLMLDRVQRPTGELAGPDDGWRAALEAVAHENLARYRRHPWLLQVNQSRPILGPSALDGMERILTRIRPMGLTDPELVSVIIMIDGYVVGAARTQVHEQEAERRTGLTDTEFWQAQVPVLEQVMASGRYPVMASLSEDAFGTDFDHFEFGLQRMLDGLDVVVARRGESAPS